MFSLFFILHCLCCLTFVTWNIIVCEPWGVEWLSLILKVTDNAFASATSRWLSHSCGWWRKRSIMNSGKKLQEKSFNVVRLSGIINLKAWRYTLLYLTKLQYELLNPKRLEFTPNDSVLEWTDSVWASDQTKIVWFAFRFTYLLRKTDSKEWILLENIRLMML